MSLDPIKTFCERLVGIAGAFHGKDKPIDICIVAAVHGSGGMTVAELEKVLPWKKTELYERIPILNQQRLVRGKEKLYSDARAGEYLTKMMQRC